MIETTGTDVLRSTLKARNKSPNAIAMIAGEIGVGVGALEDFAAGKANLGIEVLKALAKVLFDAEFDPVSGMLRSANRNEAKSMGVAPPPFDPEAHARYHAEPVGPWTTGSISLPGYQSSGRIAKPPGWA